MSDLEEAAMNYGTAQAAFESAIACNAHHVIKLAMQSERELAEIELHEAARAFYSNHYDGAE